MLCNLPDTYSLFSFFFFNDTATTEIYTLSLHDALPISSAATDLAGIGSIISEANTFAAGPTLGVLPAGADEGSAAIDRKSTHLNSSPANICYALLSFKKNERTPHADARPLRLTHAAVPD